MVVIKAHLEGHHPDYILEGALVLFAQLRPHLLSVLQSLLL